ncbi:MAG: hypothetical protein ACK559_28900, partial [bacterium]
MRSGVNSILIGTMPPQSSSQSFILEADPVCKSFGGIQAVRDAHIAVPEGSITGLKVPNGEG